MQIIFDARVIQDHFPGIARYAYNLLLALPDCLRPDEKLIALRDRQTPNTRFDWWQLTERGITLLDYSTPVFGPANLLRRPGLPLPASKDDLFHFPYYVRPYRAGRPSVTTIHDVISIVYPQLTPSVQARIGFRLLNALAIRASRRIITVSHSAAADLAHYFPFSKGKVTVIPEAAGPLFQPQPFDTIQATRAHYQLPEHFTLYLASNKPHKNLVRLVEAWNLVIRDWRLEIVIAGHQDPRYPQAQARAKELGIANHVHFIGAVPERDLPGLYSACDLFVYPSLYEGFGLTPLEAMACGAPVACSNASSLPEVSGDAAISFDPQDPRQIADACLRILTNPGLQADLRQRSLRQAAQFTWDRAARQTVDVYRSIV